MLGPASMSAINKGLLTIIIIVTQYQNRKTLMWSYNETGIELKTWGAWRLTGLRGNKAKRRIKVSLSRINRNKKQSIRITYKEKLQILSYINLRSSWFHFRVIYWQSWIRYWFNKVCSSCSWVNKNVNYVVILRSKESLYLSITLSAHHPVSTNIQGYKYSAQYSKLLQLQNTLSL